MDTTQDALIVSYVILWGVVALLGFLVVGLTRQVALLHIRLGPRGGLLPSDLGIPVGSPAPAFEAPEIPSGRVAIFDPEDGRETVIGFVRPDCRSCDELLTSIAGKPEIIRELNLILVSSENREQLQRLTERTGLAVLADESNEISSAYDVTAVPFLIRVTKEGIISHKGIANTVEELEVFSSTQLYEHETEREASSGTGVSV